MGCSSGHTWPSRHSSLQPEQNTARQAGQGAAAGRPSELGGTLHTA